MRTGRRFVEVLGGAAAGRSDPGPGMVAVDGIGESSALGALFGSGRPAGRSARSSDADERRQLTVLFYDIVGSTAMLERLDPEDTREVLLRVHDIARDCIAEHFGSLQQVMGDGGMAYFGWPVASEDAVFQSVSAAWAILQARDALAQSGAGAPDIRIGIATSVVVLPTDRGAAQGAHLGAVGVAPNLAARLETVAAPNSAVVDWTTERLCRRAFGFSRIDGLTLKGFPDVHTAFGLTGRRSVASRFRMLRYSGTALVAREAEAARLWQGWESATAGTGAAVLVEGEAGIGKSRLAEALVERIGSAGRVLTLQCQPSTSGEALHSLIGMYERAWAEWDSDPDLGQAAMETAALVRELEEDPTLSATARRRAIVEGCVAVIGALARLRPCLVLAEDLHWADEVTLAVLAALAEAGGPVMVLGTARPGTVPLEPRRRFAAVSLERLSDGEVLKLAAAVADHDLARATLDWIVEKSDGNPLFATELAAFAADAFEGEPIPAGAMQGGTVVSLRDLLAARLDMAGRARRTAQIASVIGRDVPFPLLVRLSADRFPRDELEADLDRLVQHGIQHLAADGVTYSFHHALVRDAAYESQLRGTRRELHGRIVDLVTSEPALGERMAREVLAEHCLLADRLEQGV